MTVLNSGGKFDNSGYKVSGGLHDVGASVVNALSTSLEVYVHRDGKIYHLDFERGILKTEIEVIGETDQTGTRIHFTPDPEIFSETQEFDYETLRSEEHTSELQSRGHLVCR